MENNEIPFYGTQEWEKEYLDELLKNPPQPVNFTYTIDQLKTAYKNFVPEKNNEPAPRYIEDYYEFAEYHEPGDINKVVNSIFEFYALENKNDLTKVNELYSTILKNCYEIQLPNEMNKTIDEIGKHLEYLTNMKFLNDYNSKKIGVQQQEQERQDMLIKQQEQKINHIERMNNFFNTINEVNKNNNNQQQTETYVTLEQLEPLLSESGYMCYGHGTGRKGNSEEIVDSIFSDGLRTKNNSLYYTTIGLSTPTPELKEQLKEIGMPEPTIESLKEKFNNWQHQDSKKIIIARIPTEYINKTGDRSDLDGEMFGAFYTQKQQPNGQATNYLDSKFIVGCYDVEKQAVRLNKNFERTLSPETIERLKENYKKTVEKTNARKKRQAMGITQGEINLAQQSQSAVDYKVDSYNSFEDIDLDDTPLKQDQEQITQLKTLISDYDKKIEMLLTDMQPYMQIPKVNQEISKVIEKNDEINSSKIIDSLNDYKTVVDIKQSLVSYLEKADKFIKDNVKQQTMKQNSYQELSQQGPESLLDDSIWWWTNTQQPVVEQQLQSQNITNNKRKINAIPNNVVDEFDFNTSRLTINDMYNSDGTYTTFYMMKLSTTPNGIDYKKLDELSKMNDDIRKGIIQSPLEAIKNPETERIEKETDDYLRKLNKELDDMLNDQKSQNSQQIINDGWHI